MIFSSDMSGSNGGLDLYITKKEDDNWSTPENLGKHFNSAGNELFASLDASNNLFFASDGLPGEGGYDIFVCTYNGTGWEKPVNLSGTINSKDDELAFTISRTDKQSAFYTSRAKSGKGRIQLFLVTASPSLAKNSETDLSVEILALAGIETLNSPEKTVTSQPLAISAPEKAEQHKVPEPEQQATAKNVEPERTAAEKKEAVPTAQKPSVAKEAAAPSQKPSVAVAAAASPKPAATPKAEEKKDIVVYKVQILANTRPVGSQNITVAGKTYKSFEYLYQGGYRTTIGEFSTMSEAVKLQNACRQNGYNQAFVVAFKNNIRSTDPALFK